MKYMWKNQVTGRGTILVMELEEGETIQVGELIPHEGRLLEVIGIEASRKLLAPPITSRVVGLLVREEGHKA